MNPTIAVSITTIHLPKIIETVEENRRLHGHDPILYVVTGDVKTPDYVAGYCNLLDSRGDSIVFYLGLKQQAEFLGRINPELALSYPHNCIARRNIGDLWAFACGVDVIIRLDDDNYPIEEEDFIGGHLFCGATFRNIPEVVHTESGWYNVCDNLHSSAGRRFFPRGFPYESRHGLGSIDRQYDVMGRVAVNAGLWLGDPDVDAIENITNPDLNVTALNAERVALGKRTWCPINTQNTAIASYLLPASFASPWAQRYDDIICGYVQRTLMDIVGDFCCYGIPCVEQNRNEHNLWKDLDMERMGYEYTDRLCTALRCFIPNYSISNHIRGDVFGYSNLTLQLCTYLEHKVLPQMSAGFVDWFRPTLNGMRLWASMFEIQDDLSKIRDALQDIDG